MVLNRSYGGGSGGGGRLHGQFNFDQRAQPQRNDIIRLGPQAVTATTTGAAHTLFTVDTDSLLNLKTMHLYNSTAGALIVYFMIGSVVIAEESVAANDTEPYDFGDMPLYSGEVLKVYASASSGITVTGVAQRQN